MSVRQQQTWVTRGGLIVLATLLVYLPAILGGFVWDDDGLVAENPLIKMPDGIYRFWCTTEPPDYFPLTSTTWWLEWRLWGANPRGYHAVNVLLHALSAVLLWRALERLRVPCAWWAGLIFALHPVNVESVAWIAERKNTLAMFFYAASLVLYLRDETDSRRCWYWLALGAFVLSLLSKTAVAPLPIVLLGLAWWQRGRIERRDWLRAAPFFGVALALGLVTIWFQYHRAIAGDAVRTDGLASRVATAGWAVWFYLYKALFPLELSVVYSRWQVDASSVVSCLPSALVFVILGVLWFFRRSWGRPGFFALGYFVTMLLPVLGFFNIYFMLYSLVADRWQYFSIIGAITLVVGGGAWLAQRWGESSRRRLGIALAVVTVALGGLTWQRASVWHDSESLWRDTVEKDPTCWMAHNNLGKALAASGDTEEAMRHYSQALRFRPDNANAHNNLANALITLGRTNEALAHYQQALQVNPRYARTHYNLALLYAGEGNLDRAIAEYSKTLELSPRDADAYYNLGLAFGRLGNFAEAVACFKKATRLKPEFVQAHYNWGFALTKMGQDSEAVPHLRRAVALSPNWTAARCQLALALARLGEKTEAMQQLEEARRVQPDSPAVREALRQLQPAGR